jgi:hypothetical protein
LTTRQGAQGSAKARDMSIRREDAPLVSWTHSLLWSCDKWVAGIA